MLSVTSALPKLPVRPVSYICFHQPLLYWTFRTWLSSVLALVRVRLYVVGRVGAAGEASVRPRLAQALSSGRPDHGGHPDCDTRPGSGVGLCTELVIWCGPRGPAPPTTGPGHPSVPKTFLKKLSVSLNRAAECVLYFVVLNDATLFNKTDYVCVFSARLVSGYRPPRVPDM